MSRNITDVLELIDSTLATLTSSDRVLALSIQTTHNMQHTGCFIDCKVEKCQWAAPILLQHKF